MAIPASTLIAVLKDHFGSMTQTDLASTLGVTQGTISNWENDVSTPTKPQVRRIVGAFVRHTAQNVVHPIFEYKVIDPKRAGGSWTFGISTSETKHHRTQLLGAHGIYVFYSSAGTPIYLGKSTNCLHAESKARLGADLNRPFRLPSKKKGACVGDLARYMSAYRVGISDATKNIESFLLRAFANGLYNKNSGEFKK